MELILRLQDYGSSNVQRAASLLLFYYYFAVWPLLLFITMLTSLSAFLFLLLLLFPLVHPFLPFSIFRFVYDASFLVDVADADG